MSLLASLAALLGFEAESMANRAKSLVVSYAIIALLAILGVGFLIGAGYIALADVTGPLAASLIMAGTFIVLALIVYGVARAGEARRKREAEKRRRSSETGAFLTTAALTALPALARSPILLKFGIPAALVALLVMRDKD